MARSRRKQRPRKRGRHPSRSESPKNATQEEPRGQPDRLPKTFRVMHEVAHAADTSFGGSSIPVAPLSRFDISVFLRGANALKAARLLLTESFWETAAAAVRQIFELVVNVEYVRAQSDQQAAVFRFAKFGLLQEALAMQRRIHY